MTKLPSFLTSPKEYAKGGLSPILFNLYVNDIFEMINSSMETPIYLNKNNKVNAIMYVDDLVIIAQSEVELQSSLTQLSIFCENWKLEFNTKKPEMYGFQSRE